MISWLKKEYDRRCAKKVKPVPRVLVVPPAYQENLARLYDIWKERRTAFDKHVFWREVERIFPETGKGEWTAEGMGSYPPEVKEVLK